MFSRTEFVIDCAREDMSLAIEWNNEERKGRAIGMVDALYFSDLIDEVRFQGLRNEFRFEWSRAVMRRFEGLSA